MKSVLTTLFLLPILVLGQNPKILAGPMQGHTTPNSTKIWLLVSDVSTIHYNIRNLESDEVEQSGKVEAMQNLVYKNRYPFKFELNELKEASQYKINFEVDSGLIGSSIIHTVKNYEVDKFSFLVGSCAFIGTGKDRFAKMSNQTKIFRTLQEEEEGDFMMWLGDNLYLLGDEYRNKDKMLKRYTSVRKKKDLDGFLKTRFHYSIWDDHDFGPNNCDGNYENKHLTKEVFDDFWVNPNEPHENGIYYNFKYGDCEMFMLDDRWNRNKDTTLGDKVVLGEQQLTWLKQALAASNASFKIIAFGNQVLNYYEDLESFQQYQKERDDLYSFIKENRISGVVFFSGDRHHAEVIKTQAKGIYPFYDFTCSALSSWRAPWRRFGEEWNNENRIGEISLKHNYSVVSISGPEKKREMKVTYKSKTGKILMEYTVKQEEISF